MKHSLHISIKILPIICKCLSYFWLVSWCWNVLILVQELPSIHFMKLYQWLHFFQFTWFPPVSCCTLWTSSLNIAPVKGEQLNRLWLTPWRLAYWLNLFQIRFIMWRPQMKNMSFYSSLIHSDGKASPQNTIPLCGCGDPLMMSTINMSTLRKWWHFQ